MASSAVSSDVRNLISKVRKTRRLPLPGEVVVQKGDRVAPDTVVARITLRPGIPWVIPVARHCGIEPEQLESCMLKKVGDRVQVKEVICRAESGLYGRKEYESPTDGVIEDISLRSGRVTIREEFGKEEPPIKVDVAFQLGIKPADVEKWMLKKVGEEVKREQIFAKVGEQGAFFTKTVQAPISGVITEIDTKTGYVTIARPFKEVVVKGYIDGVVAEVMPHRGVVIEAPAVRLTGIFGVGRETHGELHVLTQHPRDPVTPEMITQDCAGKIIIFGSHASDAVIQKALAVEARGIVCGTASYLNVVQSLGVKLGVGITGQEDIPLTLILMEGFGNLSMREYAFEALKALNGRQASINGATQIRAGAIRPEIVVPFVDYDGPLAEEKQVDEELSLGLRVRCINAPYFGMLGTVSRIPRDPIEIDTEARVPVVEVTLEDGRTVIVPRPNVEPF